MKKLIFPIFIFVLLVSFYLPADPPFVTARLWGRLGNQLFIVAATTSLALDNDATAVFPDFVKDFDPELEENKNYAVGNLKSNYMHILSKLDTSNYDNKIEYIYHALSFSYSPIPYHPNMLLEGWFQSEKYFAHHKNEILKLFAPSDEIMKYLGERYQDIIESPKTVSIHLRCYTKEDPNLDILFPTYGGGYVKKAVQYFEPDCRFIVFSDQIEWAKGELAGIPGNFQFVENEEYYHDFYLMSLCKHNIICNSTFSWWAAYMNQSPEKIVVAPRKWFKAEYNFYAIDLIPNEWITIN